MSFDTKVEDVTATAKQHLSNMNAIYNRNDVVWTLYRAHLVPACIETNTFDCEITGMHFKTTKIIEMHDMINSDQGVGPYGISHQHISAFSTDVFQFFV